jgi:uncharacterized protein DUF2612
MPLVVTWDSGQPNAFWDVGLQWDVNLPSPSGDVQPYLDLVTSEHQDKPKFDAMLRAVLQPFADLKVMLALAPSAYDLDNAAGYQLDQVGKWVGATRDLASPLTGVYFSFDTAGVGFDEGSWKGPFDPTTGLVQLPDDTYRTLLRARIAANQWNGTVEGAYDAWDVLFAGTGTSILLQDRGTMEILYALTGPLPDAVTLQLFVSGYLDIKPAGVRITAYVVPSVDSAPYFGFDLDNPFIAGFDTGAWGTLYPGA